MDRKFRIMIVVLFTATLVFCLQKTSYSQSRVGTTTASFLEIGVGAAGVALGDAYVSMANDLTSIYWNPAGLAFMEKSEALFIHQPWVADISSEFVATGLVIPSLGTFALSINYMGYGEMDVTSLDFQEGTGEHFSANDLAISLAYARRLAPWLSFGATAKYVNSEIWHMSASALALDLGVVVSTYFFSPTGNREDGLKIGMSISNFGSKMRYDGIDLLRPIDIELAETGNFSDARGQLRPNDWELPLIFRIGLSMDVVKSSNHNLILTADALHPNNSAEYVNLGSQYSIAFPGFGTFFIRGGYKALFLDSKDAEFGAAFGVGMELPISVKFGLKADYAYRDMGILGNTNILSVGVKF